MGNYVMVKVFQGFTGVDFHTDRLSKLLILDVITIEDRFVDVTGKF